MQRKTTPTSYTRDSRGTLSVAFDTVTLYAMADNLQSLLSFLDASPTPFHAVGESTRRLRAAGFTELNEADVWSLAPGGRHFVTRNGTSLIAFICGSQPPADSGCL